MMYLTTFAVSFLALLITPTIAAPEAGLDARATATKTVIVPAPSGFIPFRSSLPHISCDSNCGTSPVFKRSTNEPHDAAPARVEARAAATTTVYAACSTANIGDLFTIRGGTVRVTRYPKGITGGDQNNSFENATTPYDCCVFAFTRSFAVGIWQWAEGTCVTYNVDGGSQADNTYRVYVGKRGAGQSVFGNGPNGEFIKHGHGIH